MNYKIENKQQMLDYISQKEYNNIQTKRDIIKTIPTMRREYMSSVNREYKDRIFCMIFGYEKYKKNLLDLFNALNGTNYTREGRLGN